MCPSGPPPESALGSPAASEGCAEKGVPVSCGSVIARNFPPGAVRQGACPEHQAGPRGFMPRPGSLDLRLRFLRRRPPSRIGGCGQRLCSSLLFPSVRGGTGPPPLRAPAAQRSPQAGAELLPEGKPPRPGVLRVFTSRLADEVFLHFQVLSVGFQSFQSWFHSSANSFLCLPAIASCENRLIKFLGRVLTGPFRHLAVMPAEFKVLL